MTRDYRSRIAWLNAAAGMTFVVLAVAAAPVGVEARGVRQSPSAAGEAPASDADRPDVLYTKREDLGSARRAANLWSLRATTEYEAAWKLSRVAYWLGTHGKPLERKVALERGVSSGENAVRIDAGRPEGHFWLAANMGALAESFGLLQGLKYRGRIRAELERVRAIEPSWQGGLADAALGQWYFDVPRVLGGSVGKAEEHLRRALTYDPNNPLALLVLADLAAATGRKADAQVFLERLIAAPIDAEWAPESHDYKKLAAERMSTLSK